MSERVNRPPQGLSTRSEQAYQRVRGMILSGELPVGEWIRRRNLASQLNMSPTPLADAFRLWGVRVRSYTVSEMEQLYQIRSALEEVIARKCSQSLSDAQIDVLRTMAAELDAASVGIEHADPERTRQMLEQDFAFHEQLAEMSQQHLIAHELERNHLLRLTVRVFRGMKTALVPHLKIVEAIASRDPHQAEAVIRMHTLTAIEAIAPQLRLEFGDQPVILNNLD
jgi:DNA-binding GntR family transcriptional regulator